MTTNGRFYLYQDRILVPPPPKLFSRAFFYNGKGRSLLLRLYYEIRKDVWFAWWMRTRATEKIVPNLSYVYRNFSRNTNILMYTVYFSDYQRRFWNRFQPVKRSLKYHKSETIRRKKRGRSRDVIDHAPRQWV